MKTWYVANTGNDSYAGTQAAPFATLQKAISSSSSGDTINLLPGNFAGGYISGNLTNLTITAPQGGATIVKSNGHTPDGIDVEQGADGLTISNLNFTNDGSITRAGIRVARCNNITLTNNTATKMGSWGLYTSFCNNAKIIGNTAVGSAKQHGIYAANGSTGIVIQNNLCHDNAGCGIHINGDASQGGSGTVQNATVTGNTVYNNGATDGGSAINCDGLCNSVISNNLLYNNHANGIALFKGDSSSGALNNVVVNNTIVQAAGARPALNINTSSTGNTIFNNILIGGVTVDSSSSTGYKAANNITTASATLFVTGGYALIAASPAVGEGVASFNGKTAPSIDITGAARTNRNDAGCYQFAPVVTTATPQLASIQLTPASATISPGKTLQFAATAFDQNNVALAPQPAVEWLANQTSAKIDQNGLLTAPGATINVVASVGSVVGTAVVTVEN